MAKLEQDTPSHCGTLTSELGELSLPESPLNSKSFGLGPLISALNLDNEGPVSCKVDLETNRIIVSSPKGEKGRGFTIGYIGPKGEIFLDEYSLQQKIDSSITPEKYFELIKSLGHNQDFLDSSRVKGMVESLKGENPSLHQEAKAWLKEQRNSVLKDKFETLKSELEKLYGIKIEFPKDTFNTVSGERTIESFKGDLLKSLEALSYQLDDYPPDYYNRIGIEKIVIAERINDSDRHEKSSLTGLSQNEKTVGLKEGNTIFLLSSEIWSKTIHHELCHVAVDRWNIVANSDKVNSTLDYQKHQYPDLTPEELKDRYDFIKYFKKGVTNSDGLRVTPEGQPTPYGTKNPEESLCETRSHIEQLTKRAKKEPHLQNAIEWAKMELYVESGGKMDAKYWRDVESGAFIDDKYWNDRIEADDFERPTGTVDGFNYENELTLFNSLARLEKSLESGDFEKAAEELKSLSELEKANGMNHRKETFRAIKDKAISKIIDSVENNIEKKALGKAHKDSKLARELIKSLEIEDHYGSYFYLKHHAMKKAYKQQLESLMNKR